MTELSNDEADIPEQSEQLSQGEPYDTLEDRGVADVLDEGISPPEKWSPAQKFGNTAEEMRDGETLEQRLAQEEPDIEPDFTVDTLDDGEVGDRRAGRLVDPDEGIGLDLEKDMVGYDVGIDGAAAGAEEAAMHIVDESEADL
jgi:galactose mutarotase-like enzyme